MLRVATLAAVAALIAAAPASAKSIHISTAGKSSDEVKAEVFKAAVSVCRAEVGDSYLSYYLEAPCVRSTVKAALKDTTLQQVASR